AIVCIVLCAILFRSAFAFSLSAWISGDDAKILSGPGAFCANASGAASTAAHVSVSNVARIVLPPVIGEVVTRHAKCQKSGWSAFGLGDTAASKITALLSAQLVASR